MLETLSTLIGLIYGTVIDPDTWPNVLAAITEFAGAARGILILEDAIDPVKSVFYVTIEDAEWIRSYLDHYLLLNPMRLATFGQVEPGAVFLTSDLMTHQEYARSRFATEFLSQRDMVDLAAVVLEATATTITVLSVARSRAQGYADELVRHKLGLIGPHVQRAATIGRAFDRQRLETSALSKTLDQLDGAIFLLDGQGLVMQSNRGAHRLLAAYPQTLSVRGNQLCPTNPSARATLSAALARAQANDQTLGAGCGAIYFSSAASDAACTSPALVGSIISLADGSQPRIGAPYRAVAALSVRELRFAAQPDLGVLSKVYGLTRRELTVLAGIVDLGSVPQTAASLGLANETVRTHLKSIFQKTGTRRQTELVKLVAATTDPFRPTM